MSSRRFEEAERRLEVAKDTERTGQVKLTVYGLVRFGEALLAALGEQPEEPIDQAHWNKLLEASNEEWEAEHTRLRAELREVRRQHQQTIEERDELAKRVERDTSWHYVKGGPVHFAMQQAHSEFEFLVFKLASHRTATEILSEQHVRGALWELLPTLRRMVESALAGEAT